MGRPNRRYSIRVQPMSPYRVPNVPSILSRRAYSWIKQKFVVLFEFLFFVVVVDFCGQRNTRIHKFRKYHLFLSPNQKMIFNINGAVYNWRLIACRVRISDDLLIFSRYDLYSDCLIFKVWNVDGGNREKIVDRQFSIVYHMPRRKIWDVSCTSSAYFVYNLSDEDDGNTLTYIMCIVCCWIKTNVVVVVDDNTNNNNRIDASNKKNSQQSALSHNLQHLSIWFKYFPLAAEYLLHCSSRCINYYLLSCYKYSDTCTHTHTHTRWNSLWCGGKCKMHVN